MKVVIPIPTDKYYYKYYKCEYCKHNYIYMVILNNIISIQKFLNKMRHK